MRKLSRHRRISGGFRKNPTRKRKGVFGKKKEPNKKKSYL